ncbi:unnamed protein product, partial [Thlaspi arvense]
VLEFKFILRKSDRAYDQKITRSYIIPFLFQEQQHALRSGRLEERVSTWGLGILALFCVMMTVNADEDDSGDSLSMIRCMIRDNRRK